MTNAIENIARPFWPGFPKGSSRAAAILRRTDPGWVGCIVVAAVLGACQTAWPSNVDLSTVPKRNTVQLTIYNSEDITLVRETRTVTFKKGVNPLQFSWAGTLIDPSSVELKFL